MEFLIWQNSNTSRQKTFECNKCISSGAIEQRCCYIYGEAEQDVLFVQPVVVEGNVIYDKGDKIEADVEKVLEEILPDIMDSNEEMSALEALHRTNVCPKSLITQELGGLLRMESFCRDYHLPPFGKDMGYLDYPSKIIDIFGLISTTRERMNIKLMQEQREK